jgi:hypothetical protein
MIDDNPGPDPAQASLTISPRDLLARQVGQLGFYEAANAEAAGGEESRGQGVIARDDLPPQIASLLDQYAAARPDVQLRPRRLLRFDGRYPTTNVAVPGLLPNVEHLVTFSTTETTLTADSLTVRGYLLLADAETAA